MEIFVIFGCFYATLIVLDLIPTIRKKDKKTLFFSIPVYLVTLTISMMIAAGIEMPNLNQAIQSMISHIFHF